MMERGQSSMLAVRQLTSGLLLLPSLKGWKYPWRSMLLLRGSSQQTRLTWTCKRFFPVTTLDGVNVGINGRYVDQWGSEEREPPEMLGG